ncbi:MAG: UDP-4-amino-4,6-dideoxy-N-acetyl-beta-L-altrosamine transaminase [Betaproteobacteria bacterium ADurb.Bin341]|nr:MAG: UDP-4-amino-4,6-dideoxy-N-acetyl-beta-L-altrosamine transaminase [Betaproteobacteria bacterium ADurb.Bin341]
MIPYGRQDISESDIAAVEAVLRSDFLTQGPAIPRFEKAMAEYCGVAHAVAVNSATSALHIACRALGLGAGGRLWTSPNTFVASANCARYCGAEVDFVDIDPETLNMSVAALQTKLEQAEREGTLPDIVVPVHFAGQPCDMAAIAELAKRYDFAVIEDASHAVGAQYRQERTGACTYSEITVFSFHPVKIMTTGEGGLLFTRRADLHEQLGLLRSHGITRDTAKMTGPSQGDWYYEQLDLGYNYRITDMQAALGFSQMSRLDEFLARRRDRVARYDEVFRDWPISLQKQPDWAQSAHHLYPIRIDPQRCGKNRAEVFAALRATGIGVNVHYIPVHTQPYYRALGFAAGDFPEAERYYAEAISLPMFSAMTEAQQDFVIESLAEALEVSTHA